MITVIKKPNRIFNSSVFDRFLSPENWNDWRSVKDIDYNIPAVNVKETDKTFEVELAIPGKDKEDFKIEVDKNVLTIFTETETKDKQEVKEDTYTHREFGYSSFKKVFSLPETIDEDDIKAHYQDGILKLVLPKKEEALPKPKKLIKVG